MVKFNPLQVVKLRRLSDGRRLIARVAAQVLKDLCSLEVETRTLISGASSADVTGLLRLAGDTPTDDSRH